jgi:adenine-specific DNA-methyltransferase
MQNLYNDLEKLLKQDERFFAEGKILKNVATELAIKLDVQLLKLLLKDKQLKEYFFVEADGVLVFDQDKFVKFINNKEFLPDSFTAFKNHIGLAEGNEYLKDSGKIVLAWPYKDCVLEGGQDKEDVKRNEIFYNEILAPDEIDRLFEPKVLTNFKKVDKTGEHKVEQINEQDNLLIKGNNLLTLHSLKKKYRGKVKLIYIDPPYNTGSEGDTFAYNNNFKHSSWLTFIKNRLEVAKEFITEDGFIAIAIDHVELYYLGALADEIFGRENRVGNVKTKGKGVNLSVDNGPSMAGFGSGF